MRSSTVSRRKQVLRTSLVRSSISLSLCEWLRWLALYRNKLNYGNQALYPHKLVAADDKNSSFLSDKVPQDVIPCDTSGKLMMSFPKVLDQFHSSSIR
ncbi:unnamed protein product [Sphagnum troendelagicum]